MDVTPKPTASKRRRSSLGNKRPIADDLRFEQAFRVGLEGCLTRPEAQWTPLPDSMTHLTANFHSLELGKFQFTVHFPAVFQKMRSLFGLKEGQFYSSLCSQLLVDKHRSVGKSKQHFYSTADGRFILKTMTEGEQKLLLGPLAKKLLQHLQKYPKTLLAPFLGIFSLQMEDSKPVCFVCMPDAFFASPSNFSLPPSATGIFRYDLKGLMRRTTRKERGHHSKHVYQEADMLDHGNRVWLTRRQREAVLKQLEADCQFLEDSQIIDYSILLCVIRPQQQSQPGSQSSSTPLKPHPPDFPRRSEPPSPNNFDGQDALSPHTGDTTTHLSSQSHLSHVEEDGDSTDIDTDLDTDTEPESFLSPPAASRPMNITVEDSGDTAKKETPPEGRRRSHERTRSAPLAPFNISLTPSSGTATSTSFTFPSTTTPSTTTPTAASASVAAIASPSTSTSTTTPSPPTSSVPTTAQATGASVVVASPAASVLPSPASPASVASTVSIASSFSALSSSTSSISSNAFSSPSSQYSSPYFPLSPQSTTASAFVGSNASPPMPVSSTSTSNVATQGGSTSASSGTSKSTPSTPCSPRSRAPSNSEDEKLAHPTEVPSTSLPLTTTTAPPAIIAPPTNNAISFNDDSPSDFVPVAKIRTDSGLRVIEGTRSIFIHPDPKLTQTQSQKEGSDKGQQQLPEKADILENLLSSFSDFKSTDGISKLESSSSLIPLLSQSSSSSVDGLGEGREAPLSFSLTAPASLEGVSMASGRESSGSVSGRDGTACNTAQIGGGSIQYSFGSSEMYQLAIVDTLQEYNGWRKAEFAMKSIYKEPTIISPHEYSKRFRDFLRKVLLVNTPYERQRKLEIKQAAKLQKDKILIEIVTMQKEKEERERKEQEEREALLARLKMEEELKRQEEEKRIQEEQRLKKQKEEEEARKAEEAKLKSTSTDAADVERVFEQMCRDARIPWLSEDVLNCMQCKKGFGFWTRKHHCRLCGKVLCTDCTEWMDQVAGYPERQRVCKSSQRSECLALRETVMRTASVPRSKTMTNLNNSPLAKPASSPSGLRPIRDIFKKRESVEREKGSNEKGSNEKGSNEKGSNEKGKIGGVRQSQSHHGLLRKNLYATPTRKEGEFTESQ